MQTQNARAILQAVAQRRNQPYIRRHVVVHVSARGRGQAECNAMQCNATRIPHVQLHLQVQINGVELAQLPPDLPKLLHEKISLW